ncbi:DUF2778 domain-containing protein [Paraburkholderia jirisanensis]
MPVSCTFFLNRRSISNLTCPGFGNVAAYSGRGRYINNADFTHLADDGPLPQGLYYIVDRESGGRLGWLYDWYYGWANNAMYSEWFALYRNDGKIDDVTFVQGVRRGNFRLHPAGIYGVSKGCVTVPDRKQFQRLRHFLKAQQTTRIPGTSIIYYGTIQVR